MELGLHIGRICPKWICPIWISQGFCTFERCFVCESMQLHQVHPSNVHAIRSVPCLSASSMQPIDKSLRLGRQPTWAIGVTSTLIACDSTTYRHAMMNAFLRGLPVMLWQPTGPRGSSSTMRDCLSASSTCLRSQSEVAKCVGPPLLTLSAYCAQCC